MTKLTEKHKNSGKKYKFLLNHKLQNLLTVYSQIVIFQFPRIRFYIFGYIQNCQFSLIGNNIVTLFTSAMVPKPEVIDVQWLVRFVVLDCQAFVVVLVHLVCC